MSLVNIEVDHDVTDRRRNFAPIPDNEHIRNWLIALRSGTYKQGTTMLRSASNKYCCLGVLCDIVNPSGWELSQYDSYFNGGLEGSLPEYVLKTTGLSKYHTTTVRLLVNGEVKHCTLPYLNDSLFLPFSTIADIIESNIEETHA